MTNRAGWWLRAAGWRSGHAAEFLELSEEEGAFVKLKPALSDYLRRARGTGRRARSRERAQADLASLCRQVRELRRRFALAAAAAAQLGLELVVSNTSNDFVAAQDAQRAFTAAPDLCGAARRAAADAEECLAGIDSELPGLLTTSEL